VTTVDLLGRLLHLWIRIGRNFDSIKIVFQKRDDRTF
jgi:hypothetical protein